MKYGDKTSELYYDISDMFIRIGNYFTCLNYRNRYIESERKRAILQDELIEKIDNFKKLNRKCNSLQREIDNMVKAYDFDSVFDAMLGENDPEETP